MEKKNCIFCLNMPCAQSIVRWIPFVDDTSIMSHTILFCGTPEFAVPSLEALCRDDAFDVTLVVTQPDRPAGRGKQLQAPPVKTAAQMFDVPVFQPENINKELPRYLEEHGIARADFLVVVAYGSILRTNILELPTIAPINVHASLLPRWRGASPIEHAILHGDHKTGITIQRMVEALDAGDIAAMQSIDLRPDITAPDLRTQLSSMAAPLLTQTLKEPLHFTPQDGDVTTCTKIKKEDGNVDPSSMTADAIERHIRAYTPWPGTSLALHDQRIKVLTASLDETPGSIPIPCADNTTLHLITIQPAGKKAMSAADWERGLKNT